MRYDLEERTRKFSKGIIKLLINIRYNEVSKPIISQLIRSATSVGANYCEANASSLKN